MLWKLAFIWDSSRYIWNHIGWHKDMNIVHGKNRKMISLIIFAGDYHLQSCTCWCGYLPIHSLRQKSMLFLSYSVLLFSTQLSLYYYWGMLACLGCWSFTHFFSDLLFNDFTLLGACCWIFHIMWDDRLLSLLRVNYFLAILADIRLYTPTHSSKTLSCISPL